MDKEEPARFSIGIDTDCNDHQRVVVETDNWMFFCGPREARAYAHALREMAAAVEANNGTAIGNEHRWRLFRRADLGEPLFSTAEQEFDRREGEFSSAALGDAMGVGRPDYGYDPGDPREAVEVPQYPGCETRSFTHDGIMVDSSPPNMPKTEGLTFAEAVEAMKAGKKVRRPTWADPTLRIGCGAHGIVVFFGRTASGLGGADPNKEGENYALCDFDMKQADWQVIP